MRRSTHFQQSVPPAPHPHPYLPKPEEAFAVEGPRQEAPGPVRGGAPLSPPGVHQPTGSPGCSQQFGERTPAVQRPHRRVLPAVQVQP